MKCLWTIFFLSFLYSAQAQSLSEKSAIYILTCSPGDELYNTFGHTAIRVYDPLNNLDVIFNYGIFDFNTPGFYTKFLQGKLLYNLGTSTFDRFKRVYDYEKRSIYQQKLAVDSTQKQVIFDLLKENYKPENRAYKYDFFFDNCSTRPRDLFEKTYSNLEYSQDYDRKTYRNILDEYLTKMPWPDFGIDLIIGAVADDDAALRNQMFIPDYLHDHFAKAFSEGGPIIEKEDLILDHLAHNAGKKAGFLTPLVLFGILFLLELVLLLFRKKDAKWIGFYDRLWFFLKALAGIVIAFMWFGTEHLATKSNWNLLWLHPLYLIFIFYWKGNQSWLIVFKFIILIALIIALIGDFIIPQQYHIAFKPIILISIIKIAYSLFKTKHKELV